MNDFYTDYAAYLDRFFPGRKVQKISVNLGSGCPNRDGTIGHGGCIYCNNRAFTPSYCFDGGSISEQIEAGKRFFRRKYTDMDFLVYFQSYTSTYRTPAHILKEYYEEALGTPGVCGIVIGSRPDCLDDVFIDMLGRLNDRKPVFVELGAETSHDDTLRLINRGHTWAQTVDAIRRLAHKGLHVGLHLIAGLPGEDTRKVLETIDRVCALPVESLKIHHLQVIKDTPLARMVEKGEVKIHTFDVNDYLELCVKIIRRVPREIAIERFLASSPPDLVISPKWGLKNYEFTNLLINKLKKT